MTSPTSLPRRAAARASALTRRPGASPSRLLAAVAGLFVVIGIAATLSDHVELAVASVLVVQAALLGLLVLTSRRAAAAQATLHDRIDQSDTRILGDLARLRHVLLEATHDDRKDVR